MLSSEYSTLSVIQKPGINSDDEHRLIKLSGKFNMSECDTEITHMEGNVALWYP